MAATMMPNPAVTSSMLVVAAISFVTFLGILS